MKKYAKRELAALKKLKFVEGSLEEELKEANDNGKPTHLLERKDQRSNG